jgi:8-oxo-dGTP diphosphatase
MIRRFGDAPKANQRYTHRPGAYAILPRGNEVLLTFQADPAPEYQLPGGGIDPGEAGGRALHREVMEETGWSIAAPRRLGTFRRFTYMPEYGIHAEKLCHIYVARPLRQVSAPTEPGHVALWMPADMALAHLANPGDTALLAQWLNYGFRYANRSAEISSAISLAAE